MNIKSLKKVFFIFILFLGFSFSQNVFAVNYSDTFDSYDTTSNWIASGSWLGNIYQTFILNNTTTVRNMKIVSTDCQSGNCLRTSSSVSTPLYQGYYMALPSLDTFHYSIDVKISSSGINLSELYLGFADEYSYSARTKEVKPPLHTQSAYYVYDEWQTIDIFCDNNYVDFYLSNSSYTDQLLYHSLISGSGDCIDLDYFAMRTADNFTDSYKDTWFDNFLDLNTPLSIPNLGSQSGALFGQVQEPVLYDGKPTFELWCDNAWVAPTYTDGYYFNSTCIIENGCQDNALTYDCIKVRSDYSDYDNLDWDRTVNTISLYRSKSAWLRLQSFLFGNFTGDDIIYKPFAFSWDNLDIVGINTDNYVWKPSTPKTSFDQNSQDVFYLAVKDVNAYEYGDMIDIYSAVYYEDVIRDVDKFTLYYMDFVPGITKPIDITDMFIWNNPGYLILMNNMKNNIPFNFAWSFYTAYTNFIFGDYTYTKPNTVISVGSDDLITADVDLDSVLDDVANKYFKENTLLYIRILMYFVMGLYVMNFVYNSVGTITGTITDNKKK